MKSSTLYRTVAVVAVVVILAVAFAVSQSTGSNMTSLLTSSNSNSGSTTAFTTNSIQGGNQTLVATYVSSLSTPTALTTSTTAATTTSASSSTMSTPTSSSATSVTSTQSLATGGSFTYTASSQVKVLSVSATVSGDSIIGFSAQFQNIGSATINVVTGGESSLNSTITTGATNVKVVTGPRCEIAEAMSPVSPGGEWTATTPGCWSGYHYELLGPGTIGVELTLTWSGGAGSSLEIYAEFSLS